MASVARSIPVISITCDKASPPSLRSALFISFEVEVAFAAHERSDCRFTTCYPVRTATAGASRYLHAGSPQPIAGAVPIWSIYELACLLAIANPRPRMGRGSASQVEIQVWKQLALSHSVPNVRHGRYRFRWSSQTPVAPVSRVHFPMAPAVKTPKSCQAP